VAMIGILAALAIVGYRKYMSSAHSSEAQAIIQGIRAGEEAYKAETLQYLNCTNGIGSGAGNYYPQNAVPNQAKWNFINHGHPDFACWKTLNVTADSPVRYGYQIKAGAPLTSMPAASDFTSPPVWPNPPADPWYVVQATGKPDPAGGHTYLF